MKILLTGHEGGVGSNLLDFLKNKADVICFDGDVTNVENWSKYNG
jgi:dTDP-4-dehydrorhamnose reductase